MADLLDRLPGEEVVAYREGAIEVIHPFLEEVLVVFPRGYRPGAGPGVPGHGGPGQGAGRWI